MASKRKLAQRARKLTRKQSQTKPGGSSAYANKRRRMLGGWDNPRSPYRYTETIETASAAAAGTLLPGRYTPEDLAEQVARVERGPR